MGSILYQCELMKRSSIPRLYRVNISVSMNDRFVFGKGGVELLGDERRPLDFNAPMYLVSRRF